MFSDRMIEQIKKTNNPTVAGLDPKVEYVPRFIREWAAKEAGTGLEGAAQAILAFNKKLIDALYDVVPVVKPQLAYYEMYGPAGVQSFADTCSYAHSKGMLVIADGKRNDIGTTAEAYSAAYLGATATQHGTHTAFEADALTVNPYLGIDGIQPFLKDCKEHGKGIFILVKTSNPSSGQLQDLVTSSGKTIYETVAGLVDEWGISVTGASGYSSVGAVVGATYPEQAKVLRSIMKKAIILVPGYGAQGGTAADVVSAFNEDGLGAIVNASRSILTAWKSERWKSTYNEETFDTAARAEAIRMRDEINGALAAHLG